MNLEGLASMLTPESVTPEALDALYALGHRLLVAEGAPRSAAPVFRVMLACAPRDERGWLGLGECHARMEQADIALQIYGAGTVAAEPAPRLHLARARTLRAQGSEEDAEDAWRAAATLAAQADDAELLALVERERASGAEPERDDEHDDDTRSER